MLIIRASKRAFRGKVVTAELTAASVSDSGGVRRCVRVRVGPPDLRKRNPEKSAALAFFQVPRIFGIRNLSSER